MLRSLRLHLLKLTAANASVTAKLLGAGEPHISIWPLQPTLGKKLLKRRFDFAGCNIEVPGRAIPWIAESANENWHRELYSFAWVEYLTGLQNDRVASSLVREFCNGFIIAAEEQHACAWQPEITGERLHHWVLNRHFIYRGGSQRFHRRFLQTLIRHTLTLSSYIRDEHIDIRTIKGLLSAITMLPQARSLLPEVMDAIERVISRDILSDGSHIRCQPGHHYRALRHLIEVRWLLDELDLESHALNETIPLMGTALRLWTHGDNRLALFGETLMEDAFTIQRVIELSGCEESVPLRSAESGFIRFAQDNTVLIMAGQQANLALEPSHYHSSFELSEASERIVVNCGHYLGTSQMWQKASHVAAAHSTISYEIEGKHIPESENVPPEHPITTDSFEQDERHQSVTTQRGIALMPFYPLHTREIRFASGGKRISGFDHIKVLQPASNDILLRCNIRFHLHPDIRCQKQKDGSITLKSVSGTVWQFSCTMPNLLRIEESVYLGYYGKPQKTLQIIISDTITGEQDEFRWTINKKEDG